MRRYRRKLPYEKDPLVPIDRGFLQAAIEESGLTIQEVARRAKTKKQNVGYMLKEGGKGRCRASLRDRLTKILQVPEELLAGGNVVIEGWVLMVLGADAYSSKRSLYVALRLLQECLDAAERDGFNESEKRDLVHSVGILLRPHGWRRRLTGFSDLGPAGAIVISLTNALRFALQPWLSKRSSLDLPALREAAGLRHVRAAGELSPTPTRVLQPFTTFGDLIEQEEERPMNLPKPRRTKP